jgi:hypothetical protein
MPSGECAMGEPTTAGISPEQQMAQLLDCLQRAVCQPTFSYRLEEIRGIVVQLAACWAKQQQGRDRPDRGGSVNGRVS